MFMNKFKGFFYAASTSVTFGLIPLFTLPLLNHGLSIDSILFYRFSFATMALILMMLFKKESFKIDFKEIPILLILGVLYIGASLFLLMGYEFMGAGVATTIHFTYPVFVTLLMFILFREKASLITWLAILLAVFGVAKLSMTGAKFTLDLVGVIIVVLSAVAYALYIVGVNKSRLQTMDGRKLAFYVFMISSVFFAVKAFANEGIQPIPNTTSVLNLALLAVVPTVISNVTLVMAVRNIGGTMTSVLGAMEPVTAVFVGAFVFSESLTWQQVFGILLIIAAVIIIILSNKITRSLYSVFRKSRPRHA